MRRPEGLAATTDHYVPTGPGSEAQANPEIRGMVEGLIRPHGDLGPQVAAENFGCGSSRESGSETRGPGLRKPTKRGRLIREEAESRRGEVRIEGECCRDVPALHDEKAHMVHQAHTALVPLLELP